MSFWNPWAEVRQLRARLELAEGERAADARGVLRLVARHRAELKATIAKAHFRNPATGRLGRRGQTFSQEQS